MSKKKSIGRPPLSKGERTVPKSITILESHFAYLKRVGSDNLSEGVRVVTDAHMENTEAGGLHTMICPNCPFFKDWRCVDEERFVNKRTGEDMCRYNPDAIPVEEFRDNAIPVDYSRGRKKLFKTEG
jgi:hypothetical protein